MKTSQPTTLFTNLPFLNIRNANSALGFRGTDQIPGNSVNRIMNIHVSPHKSPKYPVKSTDKSLRNHYIREDVNR